MLPVGLQDFLLCSKLSLNWTGFMADEMKTREDLEHLDEQPEYEAPTLEVIGKVEQLNSEFDGVSQGPR